MKDGKLESLAEALLLLEKMNGRLSEKDQKIREQQAEIKILNEKLAVKRAREFAAKTESLKKLYESQPFLFDAEEMGIKVENQCPKISDEDIAQALKDDDLFDRKSEKKKPGRTRNKSKNLPRQKYVIDLSEDEKICSNCGSKMVKVREIVSERIVHVPSSEYIKECLRKLNLRLRIFTTLTVSKKVSEEVRLHTSGSYLCCRTLKLRRNHCHFLHHLQVRNRLLLLCAYQNLNRIQFLCHQMKQRSM